MDYQSVPTQLSASGEHKPWTPPRAVILGLGVSLLVLACLCLLAAIGAHLAAPAVIAAAIATPGLACLYTVWRSPRELRVKWSYAVRPQGLLRREGERETLIRWEDMAEMYHYPSQFAGEPLSVYRIVTAAREEIKITSSTGNHDAVGRAIVEEANRRYLESAEVLLNGGGKVEFGDIWISRTHFGFERKSLLWEALSSVGFENATGSSGTGAGMARLTFKASAPGSQLSFCSIQAYSIPYLKTFVRLLGRMPVRLENPIDADQG